MATDGGIAEHEFSAHMRSAAAPAYQLAYTMLRDSHYAEDAVQDAALKAWNARGRLADAASFKPWFLAIVANECRQVHRRNWWRRGREPLGDNGDPAIPASVGRSDVNLDLKRALAGLNADDRLALYLYYYLDMPVEEGALSMGCSATAFRSRLARATQRLRPALTGYESVDG